jgi:NADH-quinone oxidoreductase subunit N
MSPSDLYTLLPLALLGLGSVSLLLLGAFMPSIGSKGLGLAGAALSISAALVAAFCGPDPAPVAGMIAVDGLARIFIVAISAAASITLMLSTGYVQRRPLGSEEYPSLVLFAAFGMSVLASSVSLVGVFLGLESMSLALYILLASNKSDPLSGEAGLKYLIVGAISTAFFAYGLALVYVDTGTLEVAQAMRAMSSPGRITSIGLAGWAMLLVGFGFKASLFPFHFWAPDVYEGGPAPVVALLSTASKASVFAAFLRFAVGSSAGWGSLVPALWVMAALTMAFGNIAALTQNNIKRLLAYSSIAQMGYVLLALIAAPKAGGVAAVFYLIVYIAMDMAAFGVVSAFSGRDADLGDIEGIRGLGYAYPLRGMALAVSFIALAGLPPTAGFVGKFGVFYYAIKGGYVYLAVIGIITAVISVYYYLRIVVYLYMRQDDGQAAPARAIMPKPDMPGSIALAVLVAAIFYLGIFPGRVLDIISALIGPPA